MLGVFLGERAYLKTIGRLLRLHQEDARIVDQPMNGETL